MNLLRGIDRNNFLGNLKLQTNLFKLTKKKFSISKIDVTKEIQKFNHTLPVEEAYTPPSTWYTSNEFYKLECEKIYTKNWIGICSLNQLKEKGDFFTGEIVNQPYVIVRNHNDELKAFYNVCSHRASRVAIENGNCKEFVCPYHGWTYNLNGDLTKATSMKGIKNFKNKENGLKEINMKQFGNILFLNFDKNSEESFESIIDPFVKELNKYCFDPTFSDVEFVGRKEYLIKSNWKVVIDNFCDGGYHVPHSHKSLYASLDLTTYHSLLFYKCLLQSTLSQSQVVDKRIGKAAIYAFIYPNIMFARYGPWLDISVVYPINENECIVLIEWFLRKELVNDTEFIESSLKESQNIQDEDVFLCENVMKGLKSNIYDVGRYVPSKESPVYQFHKDFFTDLTKNN